MEPLRNLTRTQLYKTGKNESALGSWNETGAGERLCYSPPLPGCVVFEVVRVSVRGKSIL